MWAGEARPGLALGESVFWPEVLPREFAGLRMAPLGCLLPRQGCPGASGPGAAPELGLPGGHGGRGAQGLGLEQGFWDRPRRRLALEPRPE